MDRLKNNGEVFRRFRDVFGCKTYRKVSELTGFDEGQVSRMRNGKSAISAAFFLRACFAANMSPIDMCERVGLPSDYFFD